MKNFKRFISLLLVFVLSMAISVPAFAAETEPTIPDVEKHTIEIMLDPGESIDNESGITPYIWGQTDTFMNNVCYTNSFWVPDQYFAYEVIAGNEYSQPCNIPFTVQLITLSGTPIASLPVIAHGGNFKADWISVNPNSEYRFRVINDTSAKLHIIITYYSW